jgi:hypothetical protein
MAKTYDIFPIEEYRQVFCLDFLCVLCVFAVS